MKIKNLGRLTTIVFLVVAIFDVCIFEGYKKVLIGHITANHKYALTFKAVPGRHHYRIIWGVRRPKTNDIIDALGGSAAAVLTR